MIGNILITSAGRRVSLVKNFQEALKNRNSKGRVYTTDMAPELSSACHVADGFLKTPRVSEANYLGILKDFCLKNDISILVPTIDTELSILALCKEDFNNSGIFVAVSSKEICDIFGRKDTTESFFIANNFNTPRMINDLSSCKYPVFAKLNNSSCSIGAQKVDSRELAVKLAENSNYVFQEFIEGDEYTVDVFIDRNQNVISVVPRLRMEVRAGEVSKAKTSKDKDIINKVIELCGCLKGAYGCITIQLFKTVDSISFIEINPRFGGGYPLTCSSGADFAQYLIDDYLNIQLKYKEDWNDNTIMLRYDQEIIINPC